MANSITINIRAKDEASSEIDKVKGKLNAVSSSEGFKSVVQGVGMGVGIGAWGLLQGAIGSAKDMLGDVVQSGMDAQANQAALGAALQSSIKGWDGNREWIMKNVEANMRLGFSDDDLVQSLTRLLPITKGVGEAQQVQAAAMDLARFKSISLVDASLAIGKAMEGNKKMLKELGISVADAADAQSTLAAVQQATAGQAEAYMTTVAGKLEAVQVRIENVKQGIGEIIAQAGSNLFTGIDLATWDPSKYGYDDAKLATFRNGMFDIDTKAKAYADWLGRIDAAQAQLNATTAAASVKDKEQDDALWGVTAAAKATHDALSGTLNPTLSDARARAQEASAAFNGMKAKYDAMQADLAASNDLKELPLRIAVAKDDVVAAQTELEKARTKAQKDTAALRLQQAKDELATLELEYRSKTAQEAAYQAGQKFGDALGRGIATSFTDATGRLSIDVNGTPHTGGRALGGPVSAGVAYRVGETRPEYFIPATDGYVTPNNPASAAQGVTLVGVSMAQIVDAVDRGLYFRLRAAGAAR